MPLLEHDKAIKDYWNEVKDKYPDIPFSQFEEICKAPWNFVKFTMREGLLATLSFKYFGKFKVFPAKVKTSIKNIERDYNKNFITLEDYNTKMPLRLEQLSKIQKDVNKKSN